ncbi:MAG TPA: radical SAM protein, partial [Spirochaetota bacterium]|nr:radical SAM protein [Spirochaetota bacterium]
PIILHNTEDINKNNKLLIENTKIVEDNMVSDKSQPILQRQNSDYVLSFSPQKPLTENEMDDLYNLSFRKDFPDYCKSVPAWNMINSSITTHRGCYGACSFCAITIHQGAIISQRSKESIIDEVKSLVQKSFFNKTITDVGGPTANMYGTSCKIGWCKTPSCLFPRICPNLIIDNDIYKRLLQEIKKIPSVKNVFVSSGIRHDLALQKKDETEFLITECTSGHLKIAPEHTDNNILKLMRKPPNEELIEFIILFESIKKKYNLKSYILPYLILSFPGSNDENVKKLGNFLNKYRIRTYQYQDFTPVPQTMATAIFFAKQSVDGKSLNILSPSVINKREREILERILKSKTV